MPHILEREAETITNTLEHQMERRILSLSLSLRDTYKWRQKGLRLEACKKSCFTLMVSVKRPGVRHLQAMWCTGPCPCPILSSPVGDPVRPSRLLPTCSKTIDLPPSLSPTMLLSHYRLQFLEHKKPRELPVLRWEMSHWCLCLTQTVRTSLED